MNEQKDRHDPYPEVADVRPKHWKVIRHNEGGGRADKVNGILVVPDDERSASVSRHELGHIRWSPVKPPPVDYNPGILQSVEDARINLTLERLGVPYHEGGAGVDEIRGLFACDTDPVSTIMRAVATIGTDAEPAGREFLGRLADGEMGALGLRWVDRLRTILSGPTVVPFSVAKQESDRLAYELDELASKPMPQPETVTVVGRGQVGEGGESGEPAEPSDSGKLPGGGIGGGYAPAEPTQHKSDEQRQNLAEVSRADTSVAGLRREGAKQTIKLGKRQTTQFQGSAARATPTAQHEHFKRQAEKREIARRQLAHHEALKAANARAAQRVASVQPKAFGNGGWSGSGDLFIYEPRLKRPQPSVARRDSMIPRSATEGCVIRRPDRYLIDGAIFARMLRGGGATVLLDQSGSMSVSVEETEELCLAAGRGALVATYSGSYTDGHLRVIARGPLRADDEWFPPAYGGNTVDYAALVWLSRQRGRLVWVSDQGVSGNGSVANSEVLGSCMALCHRHRIENYWQIGQACDALKKGRPKA